MHLRFDRVYCISGGSTFFESEYLKNGAYWSQKNIAGSKIRLISNIEQKIRVTYDLQDGGHVVAKNGNFTKFWKFEKVVKNAYFGKLHTFNIFHGKTFDTKCGKNNILKYFRQQKFDHHPKISTYDVILAQNDVI